MLFFIVVLVFVILVCMDRVLVVVAVALDATGPARA